MASAGSQSGHFQKRSLLAPWMAATVGAHLVADFLWSAHYNYSGLFPGWPWPRAWVFGGGFGALTAFCQWLVLRRRVAHAGWWVLTGLLGGLLLWPGVSFNWVWNGPFGEWISPLSATVREGGCALPPAALAEIEAIPWALAVIGTALGVLQLFVLRPSLGLPRALWWIPTVLASVVLGGVLGNGLRNVVCLPVVLPLAVLHPAGSLAYGLSTGLVTGLSLRLLLGSQPPEEDVGRNSPPVRNCV